MDDTKARLMIQKVRAGILMLQQIEQELASFLEVEQIEEPIPQIKETFLGDDGKEYQEAMPYIKSKQWYCCGKPLEKEEQDGKQVYHCSRCNSNYKS